jgi:hypothetical protein
MFLFHPAPQDHRADIPARQAGTGWPLLLALALVALMVLGGVLTVPASSQTAQPEPTDDRSVDIPTGAAVRLTLTPVDDQIWLGDSTTYTATAVVTVGPNGSEAGNPDRVVFSRDVTDLAKFTAKREGQPPRSCQGATCTPDAVGEHTVEAVVPRWFGHFLKGSTSLGVRQPVEQVRLTPDSATIQAGGRSPRYSAVGLDHAGEPFRDVTRETRFTAIAKEQPTIACQQAVCVPTRAGDYTVTGTLQEEGRDPVTGTAKLTVVPGDPTTLRLEPDKATVQVNVAEAFEVIGTDDLDNDQNLTQRAEVSILRISPGSGEVGTCAKAGDKVRCQAATPGFYRITATLPDTNLSATATLTVVDKVIEPSIQVTPGAAAPNSVVEVTGTTGSCGRAGRLSLEHTKVRKRVRGEFMTRFAVPSGTPPGHYRLLLDVTCDGIGTKHATAPFAVTNQPPQAVDDPDVTTSQDRAVDVPVMENDKDPDDPDGYGTTLEPEQPEHGRTEPLADHQIRYTPHKGFVGTDRFQYHLCDIVNAAGDKQCGTATVTVTVNKPEPRPVDDPDIRTDQDQPVVIDVMVNDDHPDATRLRVRRPDRPGASVEKRAGGVRYTPEPGYVGKDRFRYDYCASKVNTTATASCPSATVTVTVKPGDVPPPPPAPQPVDDPDGTTRRDLPVVLDVTGNDRHPDVARLRLRDAPADGRADKLAGGAVRYTPDENFTGIDRFTYDYCGDAPGATRTACPSATVTVTVTPPPKDQPPPPDPEPVDDPDATTARDQTVVIDVTGNDRDPDPARLRVRDQPATGEAGLDGDAIRYRPQPGFTGTDSFTYDYCRPVVDVDRQAACPTATVTVTVTSAPVITSVAPGSASPGRLVTVTGSTGSCSRVGALTLEGTAAAAHLTADPRGNFTARLTVPAGTTPRDYTLRLSVDCQGQAQRAEERFTVTNKAPVATDDAATTSRDHAVAIPVVRNDRDPDDPDGHPTRLLANPPMNGTADVGDQSILYTPTTGFVGQDQFRYSLCDDILNAVGEADCGTATVTVTVTDTPAITSVSPASAKPRTPVVVTGSTGSCSHAGTLTLEETGVVAHVAAEPNGNFTTILTVPDGTLPRDYRLTLGVDCNGQLQQAEGSLSVTNEAPKASNDLVDTVSGIPVPIEVTGNDRDPDDPDGYPTRLLVLSEPEHGTAEVQSEQTILYTPEPRFVGQDQFRYGICDDILNAAGRADCGTATVSITVSDSGRCLAGDVSSIRVDPGKGRHGARLGITASVDPKLAACPFRLLLGGTTLGEVVQAGDDGGITAQRAVPDQAKPGTIPVTLATMGGQVLAETPFEVTSRFPLLDLLLKALLGAAALAAGALFRAAVQRWRPQEPEPGPPEPEADPPPDIRVEPHTRPVAVVTEPVPDGTRTVTVRLEPHPDPGTQWLQEADR